MTVPPVRIFPASGLNFEVLDGINLRPLTIGSYNDFVTRFSASSGSANYSNSWLYLTQACRGAFTSHGSLIGHEGFASGLGRHGSHWVFVRPRGLPPDDFLSLFGRFIRLTKAQPYVFVKKADRETRGHLADCARSNGLRIYGANYYRWNQVAPHDDDTYPEVAVHIKKLFQELNEGRKGMRSLRAALHRLELQQVIPEFSTVREVGPDRIAQMLWLHFGSNDSFLEPYINMLGILGSSTPADTWSHFVPMIEHEPVGLFAYDRTGRISGGVYASVASKRYPGLSEAMMLELFTRMSRDQIVTANLGGSETEGLMNYKRKFIDARSREADPVRGRHYPIMVLDFTPVLKL